MNLTLTCHEAPFGHYVAEELLLAGVIDELSRSWDRVQGLTRKTHSRPGGDKVYTMNHLAIIRAGREELSSAELPEPWRGLCRTLNDLPFRRAIGEQMGLDLSTDSADVGIYAHQPGDGVTVHKDKPYKTLSCILYLNPTWRPEFGGDLCLYKEDDLERPAAHISPKAGRMVLFRPGARSWHSVAPVTPRAPVRRSIQVEFVPKSER